jgi:hypothetical protein
MADWRGATSSAIWRRCKSSETWQEMLVDPSAWSSGRTVDVRGCRIRLMLPLADIFEAAVRNDAAEEMAKI